MVDGASNDFQICFTFSRNAATRLVQLRASIEKLGALEKACAEIARGEKLHEEILLELVPATMHLLLDSQPSQVEEHAHQSIVDESTECERQLSAPGRPPGKRQPKKVAVYEDILVETGVPMRLENLTQEALNRGVSLGGSLDNPPEEKVRNSLNGSKRFVNLGGNRWWLANTPLPDGLTLNRSTTDLSKESGYHA